MKSSEQSMDDVTSPTFSVSDAVALFNQMFETATPTITVLGEVANFKINQNKWVFFDIKDEESSLGCFMGLFNLRVAIEDGMQIAVTAQPTITKWGKFSLTVQAIRPVGEGSIKRAFELLRTKLDKEGLFASERKRSLPDLPQRIGVISSIDAAGYKDFVKILDERFGGLEILMASVQVQGQAAAEQIIAALRFFNESPDPPEVIAILRGGGSRDDLAAFDDELLVRAVAASRVPTIAGIGHEIDTTLVDLAADVRASTPSNAAEILVPDRREIIASVDVRLGSLITITENRLDALGTHMFNEGLRLTNRLDVLVRETENKLKYLAAALRQLNPKIVLNRGYAIMRSADGRIVTKPAVGDTVQIETSAAIVDAAVQRVGKI
ncbi:MAG: exodeoxyribonuclease VII large subunit [Candidatus Nomurabacteria bacterium]|jgi:exodeoxyribonuclease VII large subunit|nr:exodeoxyribonuclease VII large subunit [Candidatus Nomurabacteria bacterium]